MASIHGLIYLLIGIVVAIISYIVDKDKMRIFIYVGLFMMALGIAKLLSGYIFKKEPNKSEKFAKQKQQLQKKDNSDQQDKDRYPPNMTPAQIRARLEEKGHHGYVGKCAHCGTPMRRINTFCHRCGNRVQ